MLVGAGSLRRPRLVKGPRADNPPLKRIEVRGVSLAFRYFGCVFFRYFKSLLGPFDNCVRQFWIIIKKCLYNMTISFDPRYPGILFMTSILHSSRDLCLIFVFYYWADMVAGTTNISWFGDLLTFLIPAFLNRFSCNMKILSVLIFQADIMSQWQRHFRMSFLCLLLWGTRTSVQILSDICLGFSIIACRMLLYQSILSLLL